MKCVILSALLIALSTPAWAAQCAPRTMILDKLSSKYGEAVRAMGLAQPNSIVEVFVSEENGSWTVLISYPNGMSCVLTAGTDYQEFEPAPEPAGDDL